MHVMIADDQEEVRLGLRVLLEHEEDYEVIGEVSGMSELLIQMQTKKPDLVLLDWEISGLRMNEFIPVLRALSPGTRIVAMSGRPEAERAAVLSGVDAFMSKGDQPDRLIRVMEELRRKHNGNDGL